MKPTHTSQLESKAILTLDSLYWGVALSRRIIILTMRKLGSRNQKVALVVAAVALLLLVGVAVSNRGQRGILFGLEPHYWVRQVPNKDPNVVISISPVRSPRDLANGTVRCRIRNVGKKPLSMLVGVGRPSFAMEWPKEAYDQFDEGDPAINSWSEKDFQTIGPSKSIETEVYVYRWEHPAGKKATYTGQLYYLGDDINGAFRAIYTSNGHSDVGTIGGPPLTIRVDATGTKILL